MRLVLAVLLAGTGCAQVWGFDETSGGDAGPGASARVAMQRVSIGSTVTRAPLDLSGQSATFYDVSAGAFTPVPGTADGTNAFTAEVPGTPPVSLTLPNPEAPRRLFSAPAAEQRGNLARWENPSAPEPLPNSSFMVNMTLPSPYVGGETFVIQAIGPWTQFPISSGALPLPDGTASSFSTSASYSAFQNYFTGITIQPTDRVRITAADQILVLRHSGPHLTGVFQASFDQTDGVDMLSGPMVAVNRNTALMVTSMESEYSTRFAAARPALANMAQQWAVNAAPGWEVGDVYGVRLINGSGAPPATEMFGNPFESLSWRAVFSYTAFTQRQYSVTNGTDSAPIGLRASLSTVSEVMGPLTATMSAGLPITIEANTTALVTDGQMLTVTPGEPVVVDATLDRATNTAYVLRVTEVGVDATSGGAVLTRQVVLDAFTSGAPQFRLPPDVLSPGKSYFFTLTSMQGGYVNAGAGDFQTFTLPYSTASLDSAVFTVGMP